MSGFDRNGISIKAGGCRPFRPGSYSPLDAAHMRDAKGRPLPWLRTILDYRDRLETVIRGIHGGSELVGYTTRQLMALDWPDCLVRRAHRHLVEHHAPARMWDDPVL